MKVKTEQNLPRRRGRPPGTGHKQKLALQQGIFGLLDGKSAQDNALVMFDFDAANAVKHTTTTTVAAKPTSKFQINVSTDRLDIYRSPHTLNLRQADQIEKFTPDSRGFITSSTMDDPSDLPAGEFLARAGVFSFIDFDHSPIWQYCQQIWSRLHPAAGFSADLISPKIDIAPTIKSHWATPMTDTTMGHLALAILGVSHQIGLLFDYLLASSIDFLKNLLRRDEVIGLSGSRPLPVREVSRPLAVVDHSSIFEAPTPLPPMLVKADPPVLAPAPAPVSIPTPRTWVDQPIIQSSPATERRSDFWSWSFSWRLALRPVAVFLLVAIAITLPFKIIAYWHTINMTKGQVLGDAEQAMADLHGARDALTNFDLLGAQDYFNRANDHFDSAQEQLTKAQSIVTTLAELAPIDNTYKSGKNLLDLGTQLSSAGDILLTAANAVNSSSSPATLTDRMRTFKTAGEEALIELEAAKGSLAGVNPEHLPEDSREQFAQLQTALPLITSGVRRSIKLLDVGINALGDHQLRRYLIMFQNDNELRPTGGFMGSFALVDLVDGKIKNITIPKGGTYDMRAGLKERFSAPSPLHLINPRWEFQDVNWSPDWPTSAQTIADFYSRSNGPSVDGVVAINSDWLAEVLRATGPLEFPEYQMTLTPDNLEMELQKSIEFDLEIKDPKAPKKIIADLAPKMIERIMNADPSTMIALAQAVRTGLETRDIQIFFKNEELQRHARENDWDGRMKSAPFDYLAVVSANIGGGKSDQTIDQDIRHSAEIGIDGSVTDTVEITRRHFGPIDDYFTTQPNISYLRFYVPLGSKLLSAAGFSSAPTNVKKDIALIQHPVLQNESERIIETNSGTSIYSERDKTVFGNWLNLKPGEEKTAVMIYRLPGLIKFNTKDTSDKWWDKSEQSIEAPEEGVYSILIQKQAGSAVGQVLSQVSYPDEWQPTMTYPFATSTASGLIFDTVPDRDEWRAINFTRD